MLERVMTVIIGHRQFESERCGVGITLSCAVNASESLSGLFDDRLQEKGRQMVIEVSRFTRNMPCSEMIEALNGRENLLIGNLLYMVGRQSHGGKGPLLVGRRANITPIIDDNGEVRMVSAYYWQELGKWLLGKDNQVCEKGDQILICSEKRGEYTYDPDKELSESISGLVIGLVEMSRLFH